ncbi:hypothetical protein EGW08_003660 [Elysia chlorotica]|uniref:Uncharacterized protein n=1 Tax=Elysia chlorotica TaxID=188477 RepID=A0A3S1BPT9_ELYCH|nr:hypothetical protein EGW08_003660 [Elysia chlorotica]
MIFLGSSHLLYTPLNYLLKINSSIQTALLFGSGTEFKGHWTSSLLMFLNFADICVKPIIVRFMHPFFFIIFNHVIYKKCLFLNTYIFMLSTVIYVYLASICS